MRKLNKGFTLVELVVVITIIAILIALAILAINTVRRQARNTQLRNDAQTIKIGLESRFSSEQDYPEYSAQSAYAVAGAELTNYLDEEPTNPSSNGALVCYERSAAMADNIYNLWVITEERADTIINDENGDSSGAVGLCDDGNGVDDAPPGDDYSLR